MIKLAHLLIPCVVLAYAHPVLALSPSQAGYKADARPSILQFQPKVSMGVYGGYGIIDGAYGNDGHVAFQRLTLGGQAFVHKWASFGMEVGVQSGNVMRLYADPALITLAGGLPIQASLKPLVDALLTFNAQLPQSPIFTILKAGVAYRQLQFDDRTSTRDSVHKVNGELQAGLGYRINEHASLSAFYQGIYSGETAGVSLDNTGAYTYLKQIPTQQAIFIGFEYCL